MTIRFTIFFRLGVLPSVSKYRILGLSAKVNGSFVSY
jgi:hypothetical protein